MEVQREIVHILDSFTLLTAELIAKLTDELTARKKQYEFYRNELLKFSENEVENVPLGELYPDIRNGFVGTVTPFFQTKKMAYYILEVRMFMMVLLTTRMLYMCQETFIKTY